MPAELVAPAPAAPAAAARPAAAPAAAPAAPAAAEPSPGGAQGVKPAPAGTIPAKLQSFSDKPESQKSKVLERLKNRAGTPEKKAAAPAAPAADEVDTDPEPGADQYARTEDEPAAPADPDEVDDMLGTPKVKETPKPDKVENKQGDKKKVNPWKLIDEHKAAVATKEKEIAELRKMIGSPEARKSEIAELETLRTQNKELLDKIRYVEYQSHPDFTKNYEVPYKDSWKAAMKNVKGVTVATEDGTGGREMTPQDMFDLVVMSNVQANQAAKERYGDLADIVMRERDKIRTAYDARETALESAKTEGAAKIEAEKKARFEAFTAMNAKVKAQYDAASEKVAKRKDMAEFFQDIDGDEEANNMLREGYAFVDDATKHDVFAEGLSDDERSKIVKKHAAVRHRAAAFGRARYLLARERAEHAVTKAKLAEFQSTVPNRGSAGTPTVQQSNLGGSKMQQMLNRLQKKAQRT